MKGRKFHWGNNDNWVPHPILDITKLLSGRGELPETSRVRTPSGIFAQMPFLGVTECHIWGGAKWIRENKICHFPQWNGISRQIEEGMGSVAKSLVLFPPPPEMKQHIRGGSGRHGVSGKISHHSWPPHPPMYQWADWGSIDTLKLLCPGCTNLHGLSNKFFFFFFLLPRAQPKAASEAAYLSHSALVVRCCPRQE